MTEQPPKTILVVDDDSDNRSLLKDLLEREMYSVEEADSAEDCLGKLKQRKPDLVVLDVMMPGMSGTDLCAVIKQDPRFMDVMVILVSGVRITSEDHVFGLEIGADDYITRPFQPRELVARVEALFRLRDGPGSFRRQSPYAFFEQPGTEQTAGVYGQQAIRRSYPDEFAKLRDRYADIINEAVEQRFYKSDGTASDMTRELAHQLGFLKAGARDVIELHKAALEKLSLRGSARRAFYIKEESRLLLVEVMGYLLNYYRSRQ